MEFGNFETGLISGFGTGLGDSTIFCGGHRMTSSSERVSSKDMWLMKDDSEKKNPVWNRFGTCSELVWYLFGTWREHYKDIFTVKLCYARF